jgi:hypothetical protein
MREPKGEEHTRETSFQEILLYVLGFLGTIALLAFAAVWLIRTL